MIYNTVADGFNSMRSSLSIMTSRLNDIIKLLKNINKEVGELTDEQKNEFSSKWLNLIGKVKKKFQIEEINANIDNCFNAMFKASYDSSDTEIVATYSYSSVSNGVTSSKILSSPVVPSITVTLFGEDYNLEEASAQRDEYRFENERLLKELDRLKNPFSDIDE